MSNPIRLQGSVLFVADLPRMTQFYRALTAWPVTEKGDAHIRLGHEQQELVLHRAYGVEAGDTAPRVETPLKLVFVGDSVAITETVVGEGGTLLTERAWSDQGFVHLDCIDVEGNIFQLVYPE